MILVASSYSYKAAPERDIKPQKEKCLFSGPNQAAGWRRTCQEQMLYWDTCMLERALYSQSYTNELGQQQEIHNIPKSE